MRRRELDIAAMLGRTLVSGARAAGCELTVQEATGHSWASATFVGEQVSMTLHVGQGSLQAWIATLPEADLVVQGCVVADLTVRSFVAPTVKLEALVLRAA